MIRIFSTLLLFIVFNADEPWSRNLDVRDGLSYIRAAEDLKGTPSQSNSKVALIKELYVLAAVIDPIYKESAILGVISVESDDEVVSRLHNIRTQPPLLVSGVVHNEQFSSAPKVEVEYVCQALTAYRMRRALSPEQLDALKAWSYLFPSSFENILRDASKKKRNPSTHDINATLKVELFVLGGSTLWSADVVTVGNTPVVLSEINDLATLIGVAPSRKVRRDGRWESE